MVHLYIELLFDVLFLEHLTTTLAPINVAASTEVTAMLIPVFVKVVGFTKLPAPEFAVDPAPRLALAPDGEGPLGRLLTTPGPQPPPAKSATSVALSARL